MSKVLSFPVWFGLALVWTGAMAYLGYTSAPYVPLDMGGADAATDQAFQAAMMRHVVTYGLLAAVPPLLLLGVMGLFRRGR